MLCGKLPFDEESNKEVFKKIKTCNYKFPRQLNEEVKDLIARMLHPE
jgi:serine/threonine protein kinase